MTFKGYLHLPLSTLITTIDNKKETKTTCFLRNKLINKSTSKKKKERKRNPHFGWFYKRLTSISFKISKKEKKNITSQNQSHRKKRQLSHPNTHITPYFSTRPQVTIFQNKWFIKVFETPTKNLNEKVDMFRILSWFNLLQ